MGSHDGIGDKEDCTVAIQAGNGKKYPVVSAGTLKHAERTLKRR
ncbi:MAG: hypothetical protein ACREX1_16845 [Advenella sp.]